MPLLIPMRVAVRLNRPRSHSAYLTYKGARYRQRKRAFLVGEQNLDILQKIVITPFPSLA